MKVGTRSDLVLITASALLIILMLLLPGLPQ
jgi:hypothetical protein